MRTRTAILFALLALVNGGGLAWSQGAPYPAPIGDNLGGVPIPSPLGKATRDVPTEIHLTNGQERSGLSDWITYRRPGCSQHGSDPAVQTEIYLRSGAAFSFGGHIFGDILNAGWMIQGGGKSLFFDDSYVRAWYVDVSLANISSWTNDQAPGRPVFVAGQTTVVQGYNRTFVGLGLGRQWYLMGDGRDAGPNLRVSADAGGRWGSASATFTTVKHRSDVIGGIYVGLQADMEMPMASFLPCASCGDGAGCGTTGGCNGRSPCEPLPCIFVLGLRTEWAYTWSDVLQQVSDVQDVNLLVHLGVRY